ncbi:MAG: TolC family protein [Polyangiaceae bacterium]|nr:TolC family protein [Polyangiaceae bacterium]
MVEQTRVSRARTLAARAALTALVALGGLTLPVRAARAQPLTADEAVRRAAGGNPTLRGARADLAGARASLEGELGARRPVFFAGVNGHYTERLSGGSDAVARSSEEGTDGEAGIRYTTDIGTALEAGLATGVVWRNSTTTPSGAEATSVGPSVDGQLYLNARQPLLRGAGTDAVLAPLRDAEVGLTQAERAREQAESELLLAVLTAYYELWYAEEAVSVEEQALAVAQRQYDEAELRQKELGTEAPVDVLSFATQLATGRQSLSNARATRAARAIALGRQLALGAVAARTLDAVTPPPESADPPPLPRLLDDARARSSELAALAAQVEAARIGLASAAASDAPRLDLTATFAMSGLWNDDSLPGLKLPDYRPAFAGTLGLELELPLGGSREAAAHARAAAALESAQARYDARVDALEAEIATGEVESSSAREQAGLAAETARVAGALAEAERQRYALGKNTPNDLVKAQQTEREAALRELRALVDRALANLALEHQTGRLRARYEAYFEDENAP